MDQIIVKGLRVRGKHGVTMQENTFGQEFEVDAVLDCDLTGVLQSDDFEQSFDRKKLVRTVTDTIGGVEHCDTPEYLAEKIIMKIFDEFENVERIDLLLKQLQPPVLGDYDYIAVHLVRNRK